MINLRLRDEWTFSAEAKVEENEKQKKKEGRKKRRRRRIERNRSKESCVLITQFHVLSVRSTSPAFVEERNDPSSTTFVVLLTQSFSRG